MASYENKTQGGGPYEGGMNPPPYTTYPSPPYPQTTQAPPPPAVNAGTYIVVQPVGPHTTSMTCPSCRAQIMTRVERESSTKTHLIAALLCIVGCWPCCLLPYCMDSCQSATHYCPACGTYLGNYTN